MKHKQTRRLFALLLVFALVIGLLPSVLADNEPALQWQNPRRTRW